MKASQRVAFGFAILYAVSLVAILAPTASAAQAEVTAVPCAADSLKVTGGVTTANPRLAPESGIMEITACAKAKVDGGEACVGGTIRIQFIYVTAGPIQGAIGSVTPALFEVTENFPTGTAPVPVSTTDALYTKDIQSKFQVQLTRKARALEPMTVEIQAKALASGAAQCTIKNQITATSLGTIAVVPDYLAVMFYEPQQYFTKTGQNKIALFAVKMTNLGNFPTKVASDIEELGKKKLGAVIPPGQTVIESKAGNEKADNTATPFITVKTPYSNGYTNGLYTFKTKFLATANTNQPGIASKDEQPFIFSVQVQGVYVPGFDAASMIASLGVALVALGIARRGRE